ncbi:DUF302 domain-containing protein [Marinoscillum sp.]|uniref:DUF302 domain-containing protein n=1 Tax=Marinoscillum sp. TaxID=2024838 RepID=UPI003BABC501
MLRYLIFILPILATFSEAFGQNLTVYKSEKSVDETVAKIISIIESNDDLMLFETVAHDSIAKARGLELLPTRSILFEDPDLTTALLQCQPTAALDLPLEIIVWEEFGDIYIGFMDPKFMRRRFMITDCEDTLNQLTSLMTKVTMDALREL